MRDSGGHTRSARMARQQRCRSCTRRSRCDVGLLHGRGIHEGCLPARCAECSAAGRLCLDDHADPPTAATSGSLTIPDRRFPSRGVKPAGCSQSDRGIARPSTARGGAAAHAPYAQPSGGWLPPLVCRSGRLRGALGHIPERPTEGQGRSTFATSSTQLGVMRIKGSAPAVPSSHAWRSRRCCSSVVHPEWASRAWGGRSPCS